MKHERGTNLASVSDLLSLTEVSELLGVRRRRLTYLIEEGRVPVVRVGRQIFISKDDLDSIEGEVLRDYRGKLSDMLETS